MWAEVPRGIDTRLIWNQGRNLTVLDVPSSQYALAQTPEPIGDMLDLHSEHLPQWRGIPRCLPRPAVEGPGLISFVWLTLPYVHAFSNHNEAYTLTDKLLLATGTIDLAFGMDRRNPSACDAKW